MKMYEDRQPKIRLGQAFNLAHAEFMKHVEKSPTTPMYRCVDETTEKQFLLRVRYLFNLLEKAESICIPQPNNQSKLKFNMQNGR